MPHIRVADIEATRAFYVGFLGFEVGMDEPGFLMMRSPTEPTTQVLATTPERDAADPDTAQIAISIEVGDVDAAHARARDLGLPIVYPLTDEPGACAASSSPTPTARSSTSTPTSTASA